MKVANNIMDNDTMTIVTKPFGTMEIESTAVIDFPEGIFAFESLKKYTLLETRKKLSFQWLQSLEEKNIAFLVTDPVEILPSYSPKIHKESFEMIRLEEQHKTGLFCIVTIPNNEPQRMTINLQGPIIINFTKMLAAQFISEDDSHHVRHSVFELLEENKLKD